MPSSPLIKFKSNYLQVFLIATAIATIFFLPFIINDNGYFLYYGDFNVQQVPFYQMCHDAVREGNIFWSFTTDLGSNFISSYSFYLLGSPFFWLTLPFPSAAVPYLMGPLLILKFATAAVTSFAFIKRFVKYRNYAIIGSLLYAFSGFTVYNIFFNHFHEPIAFFPLLLIALEEYIENNKKGWFALAVAFNCIVNYFFFAGMVVFVIIYFFVRISIKEDNFKISIKKFLWLAFEAVIGLAMSAVLLLPSIITVMQNPRTSYYLTDFNALFYGWNQRYGAIIESFFFPPDIPARPNFFPGSEAKWSSVAGWLPFFSMTGVFAFFAAKRKHWAKRILLICLLMAIIPILNSFFFLLNGAYYARWFYMPILIMSLVTSMSLDDETINWSPGINWTAGITLFIAFAIAFLPKKNESNEPDQPEYLTGLMQYPDRFWIYVVIAVVSLLGVYIIIKLYRKDKLKFSRIALSCIAVTTVIYSGYIIFLGKTSSADVHNYIIPYSLNGGKNISLPDTENCRIDVLSNHDLPEDNQAMFWQIPTIQAFHSIVPASVMEFYPTVGVSRDVGSRPTKEHYALRAFLSVRWLFNTTDVSDDPPMPGFSEYTAVSDDTISDDSNYSYNYQNGFYIYQNDNYIPFGFTYDHYITRSEYNSMSETEREKVLLRAIVVEDNLTEKYNGILPHLDDPSNQNYSEQAFFEDCTNRKNNSAHYFSRDNRGFDSQINLTKENFVFFSVPYEEGWSVKVNGKDAEVIKTNVGFMAVLCPPGENSIRFNYMTPGLMNGLLITLASIFIFILYIVFIPKLEKKLALNKLLNPKPRRSLLVEIFADDIKKPDPESDLDNNLIDITAASGKNSEEGDSDPSDEDSKDDSAADDSDDTENSNTSPDDAFDNFYTFGDVLDDDK